MTSELFSGAFESAVARCLAPAALPARPAAHDFLALFRSGGVPGSHGSVSAQVDALTATATATAEAEAVLAAPRVGAGGSAATGSLVAAQAAEIARLAARVAELERGTAMGVGLH